MCLLVLGGDPAAWRVSGGHGSIPQCPGEACRELNGSDNAISSCPFVKDKSFKSHRPIRLAFFLQWLEEKEKKAGAAGARPEAGEKEEGKGKEEEGRRRVYELCTVV